ncbi:MAG: hypothetical protein AMJ92_02345 [candidate division Zixibacteria bacterium SM23_81]|nr:MAG: hypothetical protein AMJ92_02345 [candidate division Zixibacteria bacterium SM23_81]
MPGCLLQFLIGFPLKLWANFKAPNLLIGLFHLAAMFILIVTLRQTGGLRFTAIFLAIYWLSPWRLYHSGFIWGTNFLFLPAAVHFWACWKLKDRPGWFPSAALLGVLVLGFQLHASVMILVVVTFMLLVRKLIRIEWRGALLGVALGALPLVPSISALLEGSLPSFVPRKGFIGYGLLRVHPVLKSILYWFRLGSLDIGQRFRRTIFFRHEWYHGHLGREVLRGGLIFLYVLAILSVFLCVISTWWYFRQRRRLDLDGNQSQIWIRSYAISSFFSIIIAACLSPVTMQGWYMVVALHAACLPVAAWIDHHWRAPKRWITYMIFLFILLRIPIVLTFGLGHNIYRKGPIPEKFHGIAQRVREILPADVLEDPVVIEDK